jgi:hypothetical protein
VTRRRLLALVLAPTLLLGLGIGSLVVVDDLARRADVERADSAAERYEEQLAAFRTSFVDALGDADATDPRDVERVLQARRDDVPDLEPVDPRGEQGSSDYVAARTEQAQLSEALERLEQVVQRAQRARTFVLAANRALDVDPASYAPPTVVTSGAPLRAQLLPPMRAALATFEAVEVPPDAQDARDAVRAALQHVITEGEGLAARLDAGQSGSFQYAEQYTRARDAVQGYADGVRADLREALDRVVAGAGRPD